MTSRERMRRRPVVADVPEVETQVHRWPVPVDVDTSQTGGRYIHTRERDTEPDLVELLRGEVRRGR